MQPPSEDAIRELSGLLPRGIMLRDPDELRRRARDWWPLSRLRETRGDAMTTPDLVVLPTSTEEVSTIVAWANARGVAVVARGLGSGVCGAVTPTSDCMVIELTAMNRILSVSDVDQLVHVEAGARGDLLEAALNDQGLTLGHYPQSINLSTVGGWIATWSSGQASPGYGSIEDRVVGLTFVRADGSVVHQRPLPRPAVGPDLRQLLIGSEGSLGIITDAWLACAPLDPEMVWQAMSYSDFETTLAASRQIFRADIGVRVLRGWDEADTKKAFGASREREKCCVGLVGIPATAPDAHARLAAVERIALANGATALAPDLGEKWWAHRLDAVDLFESVLGSERALGVGTMLDTVELTALWSDLPSVYHGVRNALEKHAAEVRAHFSHVYSTGAALYFTFILKAPSDDLLEVTYERAWSCLLNACLDAGGSIAHHHGTGQLKRHLLERELGPEGLRLLETVKGALDPMGILNPGVLS